MWQETVRQAGLSDQTYDLWVKPTAQVSDPLGQDLIFGQAYSGPQLLLKQGVSGVRATCRGWTRSRLDMRQFEGELP